MAGQSVFPNGIVSRNLSGNLNSVVTLLADGELSYGNLLVDTNGITGEALTLTSLTANEDAMIRVGADGTIVASTATLNAAGDIQVPGDVSITGNLTVNGTEFITNTETVQIEDNILVVNNGETGPGVTSSYAGIRVDRGTETDYFFAFDEIRDGFVVGVASDETSGNLSQTQMVATREDNPTEDGVAVWNNTARRFDTFAGLTFDATAGDVLTVGVAGTSTTINVAGTTALFDIEGSTSSQIGLGSSTFTDTSANGLVITATTGDIAIGNTASNMISLDTTGVTVGQAGTDIALDGDVTIGTGASLTFIDGGATILSFVTDVSVDTGLDNTVPTTTAVKDYVDAQITSSISTSTVEITSTGSTVIDAVDLAVEADGTGGVEWDVVIDDGTNFRMSTVMGVSDGDAVEYSEMATSDIGDTTGVSLIVAIVGSELRLVADVTSGSWNIRFKKYVVA